jgi:hypothetical protein
LGGDTVKTAAGLALVAFAVWLAWAIGHDYGKRHYERPAAIGDQKR